MDEDDAVMAITMWDLFMNPLLHLDDMDEDEIRAPFLFTFEKKEDMEFFMQDVQISSLSIQLFKLTEYTVNDSVKSVWILASRQ